MALTASVPIFEKYDPTAIREDFPATDSTQYFKGGLVAIDNGTGKLVKLTNAISARSVWLCEDEVLTGVSTTVRIGVRSGIFKLINGDTILATDVGKLARVGASGDDSAFKGGTDAGEAVLGTIEGVDAASGAGVVGGAGVYVKLTGYNNVVVTATAATNVTGS